MYQKLVGAQLQDIFISKQLYVSLCTVLKSLLQKIWAIKIKIDKKKKKKCLPYIYVAIFWVE